MTAGDPKTKPARRTPVIFGAIGATLEWFDFTLYLYLSPIIARLFFPSDDPLTSLMATFGVFAAGYLMRPLGALFFGSYGDRRGRKAALTLSVAMMSGPMVLIGLLPTHASIGAAAAVLLVLLRLVQGFSVGGEFGGSIVLLGGTAPLPHFDQRPWFLCVSRDCLGFNSYPESGVYTGNLSSMTGRGVSPGVRKTCESG